MKYSNIIARDLYKMGKKISLELIDNKRAKHPTYWYYLDGRKQFKVMLANDHGKKPIGKLFLKKIRNQLALSTAQFMDLVECPMSAEEYERIVRERPDI